MQLLAIEIADRNPVEFPEGNGIPYRLLVESSLPAINTNDFVNVFEENRIVKNLNAWRRYKHVCVNLIERLMYSYTCINDTYCTVNKCTSILIL